jgi:DNA-binding HxlR family transcriptional regulator
VSKKAKEPEYEDIIRFEPQPILLVTSDEANQVLWDFGHSGIIRILRQRPMTLREIEKEYNKLACKEDYIDPKSDTTLYRYVKALEKVGLVTQAGKRVYLDKNATEILYSRTAKVFQNQALHVSYWESERGRRFYERLYAAIKYIYDGHVADKECLRKFILKYERAREKEFEELYPKLDEESLQSITDGDWWEIDQTLGYSSTFGLLLNRPEFIKQLAKCFKKKV